MLTPKQPAILVTAAILCFAGVYAEAAEIHDGDTGYIADNFFTDPEASERFSITSAMASGV